MVEGPCGRAPHARTPGCRARLEKRDLKKEELKKKRIEEGTGAANGNRFREDRKSVAGLGDRVSIGEGGFRVQVSLGVIGILRRQGAVLMAERGESPHARTWAFPGGGIEDGELPEQAIVREWHEEMGIRPEVLGLLGVSHRAVKDDTHILYMFALEAAADQIRVDGQEAIRVAWVTERDLDGLEAEGRLASPRDAYVARFILQGGLWEPLRQQRYVPPVDTRTGKLRTTLYLAGREGRPEG